jgi:two-component system, LuxR family, response regulator FixJ
MLAAKTKRQRSTRKIAKPGPSLLNEKKTAATVVIVDDDPSTLSSLRRLLVASGFQVQAFDRPSALLASAIPRSNACMVVDINLPEMTGIEMCEKLKSTNRALPTILITGRTDRSVHALAAGSGAVTVLLKPFDQGPLLDAIGRALALST